MHLRLQSVVLLPRLLLGHLQELVSLGQVGYSLFELGVDDSVLLQLEVALLFPAPEALELPLDLPGHEREERTLSPYVIETTQLRFGHIHLLQQRDDLKLGLIERLFTLDSKQVIKPLNLILDHPIQVLNLLRKLINANITPKFL